MPYHEPARIYTVRLALRRSPVDPLLVPLVRFETRRACAAHAEVEGIEEAVRYVARDDEGAHRLEEGQTLYLAAEETVDRPWVDEERGVDLEIIARDLDALALDAHHTAPPALAEALARLSLELREHLGEPPRASNPAPAPAVEDELDALPF